MWFGFGPTSAGSRRSDSLLVFVFEPAFLGKPAFFVGCTEVGLDFTGDLGGEAAQLQPSDVGLPFFCDYRSGEKEWRCDGDAGHRLE